MSYSYQKKSELKKTPTVHIYPKYILLETILIFQILFFMSSIGSYFYYYFNFSLSSLLITLTKRSSKEAGPGLGKNIFYFSFLFDKWNLYIILWSICFIIFILQILKKISIDFFKCFIFMHGNIIYYFTFSDIRAHCAQFVFLHKKYILKNWSRQIQIVTLLDHIHKKWPYLMIDIFVKNFFLLYTFAAICLVLWKFLLWKLKFWHGP